MTFWQAAYFIALVSAVWAGKPSADIVAVMAFNFIASMALGANPEFVAMADLIAAALLIGGNARANTVALLFAAMAGLEVIASRLSVPSALIYTGTDALAFLQCGVIGGANRGLSTFLGAACRRGADRLLPLAQGGDQSRVARDHEPDCG